MDKNDGIVFKPSMQEWLETDGLGGLLLPPLQEYISGDTMDGCFCPAGIREIENLF